MGANHRADPVDHDIANGGHALADEPFQALSIFQGVGMDEATVSRIFDRFYQGDTSRSKEGVGLGLSLVRRIVDILGCTVDVKSVKDEGSTFIVHVPPVMKNQGGVH